MSAQIIGFDEACACESPANREVDVPPGDLHPFQIGAASRTGDGRLSTASMELAPSRGSELSLTARSGAPLVAIGSARLHLSEPRPAIRRLGCSPLEAT